MSGVGEEFGQGSTGAGGDDVEGVGRGVFHAGVLNGDGQFHALGGGGQKGAFLGRGLVKRDRDPAAQHFGQHQAGKAGTRAQID